MPSQHTAPFSPSCSGHQLRVHSSTQPHVLLPAGSNRVHVGTVPPAGVSTLHEGCSTQCLATAHHDWSPALDAGFPTTTRSALSLTTEPEALGLEGVFLEGARRVERSPREGGSWCAGQLAACYNGDDHPSKSIFHSKLQTVG